jgi:transcriptional regulator GlxA family with amidase domain
MTMKRREFLERSATLGMAAAIPSSALRGLFAGLGAAPRSGDASGNDSTAAASPLKPPAKGSIPVAFLISDGAVIIDFCGPWEVFQDVSVPGRSDNAFELYTVAETTKPIQASAGMKIVPDYTFASAPAPKVVVIPAQGGRSAATLDWLRKCAKSADVIMSVCTGAFLLAKTGLLSGKAATTHHSSFRTFASQFPDIRLDRGARYVESGNLATAGGLSSGIDLALRVAERYWGREVVENTAYYMEYQGQGWKNPNSNQVYAVARVSTTEHPLCVVCEMDIDIATAPKSVVNGKTYYFCSKDHKATFDAEPAKYMEQAAKR